MRGNHHRAVRLSRRVGALRLAVPQPGDQCDADDEVLVDRFLVGDHAAFNALVLRYKDRPHRFVGWSVGSDEADDATQDVFVEAYRSLVTWRRRSPSGPGFTGSRETSVATICGSMPDAAAFTIGVLMSMTFATTHGAHCRGSRTATRMRS